MFSLDCLCRPIGKGEKKIPEGEENLSKLHTDRKNKTEAKRVSFYASSTYFTPGFFVKPPRTNASKMQKVPGKK